MYSQVSIGRMQLPNHQLFQVHFPMQLRFPQLILILFVASTAEFASAEPVDFVRDVQPILVKHCIVCHGPGKQESGYRIDLFETLMRGGESETVAVVTAEIEQSHLIARVTYFLLKLDFGRMFSFNTSRTGRQARASSLHIRAE